MSGLRVAAGAGFLVLLAHEFGLGTHGFDPGRAEVIVTELHELICRVWRWSKTERGTELVENPL
jgi:hypothetical protein